MIEEINKLIAERTKLGLHLEPFRAGGRSHCWMIWSNAAGKWHANPATRLARRVKRVLSALTGKEDVRVALDANEILVPYNFKEVQKVIGKLKALPLYAGSFEANS